MAALGMKTRIMNRLVRKFTPTGVHMVTTLCLGLMLSPLPVFAMSREDADKTLKNMQFYSTDRRATKIREEYLESTPRQCNFGFATADDGSIVTSNAKLYGLLRKGDVLVSINNIDFRGLTVAQMRAQDLSGEFLQRIDKLKLNVGDTATWKVNRNGNDVELEFPCLSDRRQDAQKVVDFYRALSKYDGREYLKKYIGADCTDPNTVERLNTAAEIEIRRKRIKQGLYNEVKIMYARCALSNRLAAYQSGYYLEPKDDISFDKIVVFGEETIGFLRRQYSNNHADELAVLLKSLEDARTAAYAETTATKSAEIPSAPFGTEWGLLPEQLASLGSDCSLLDASRRTISTYSCSSMPKPFSDADYYLVIFDANNGLQKISAVTNEITGDLLGTRGKEKFNRLSDILESKYGRPSEQSSIQKSGLNLYNGRDEFYQCLAYDGCGLWVATFQASHGGSITLELKGSGRGIGHIVLTYEGPDWIRTLERLENRDLESDLDVL